MQSSIVWLCPSCMGWLYCVLTLELVPMLVLVWFAFRAETRSATSDIRATCHFGTLLWLCGKCCNLLLLVI